jgi:hypothetical protein
MQGPWEGGVGSRQEGMLSEGHPSSMPWACMIFHPLAGQGDLPASHSQVLGRGGYGETALVRGPPRAPLSVTEITENIPEPEWSRP